jgi:hypothetical protein
MGTTALTMHVSRRMKVLAVASLVLLAAAGCRKSSDKAVETPFETASPTPTPVSFELIGHVVQVFNSSDFSNAQGREDFGVASPTTSPTTTASTQTAPGGVVVRVESLSQSLTDCGFAVDDRVPIVFDSQVRDNITTAQEQGNFPKFLTGERLGFKGDVEGVSGECVLVAHDVQVGGASPTATTRTTRRSTPTPTHSPSPTPTHSPSPSPTHSPTPSPSLVPSPT